MSAIWEFFSMSARSRAATGILPGFISGIGTSCSVAPERQSFEARCRRRRGSLDIGASCQRMGIGEWRKSGRRLAVNDIAGGDHDAIADAAEVAAVFRHPINLVVPDIDRLERIAGL